MSKDGLVVSGSSHITILDSKAAEQSSRDKIKKRGTEEGNEGETDQMTIPRCLI